MQKYLKWIGYICIIAGFFVIYLGQPEETFGQTALRVLNITQGGTGTSTAPGLDQLLIGNSSGDYVFINKSSLTGVGGGSISTSTVPTIGNLAYWTSASALSSIATGTLTESASGLEFDQTRGLVGGSAVLSLTSGFGIPLTASTTNWNTFYDTPSNRITAGNNLSWTGNTISGTTFVSTSTAGTAGSLAYFTGGATIAPVATGTLTETTSGLEFSSTQGLVGGSSVLSITSGFTIPSTTRATNWDNSYASTTALNATSPLVYTGTTGNLAMLLSNGNQDGYLNTTNWNTFNNKVATSAVPTIGNIPVWTGAKTLGTVATTTLTGTAPIVFSQPISVIGASPSIITCNSSSGSQAGCLSNTDWTIFNNKISSSSLDTSLELANLLTDEVGTGFAVFNNAPSFTGTASFNALTVTNTSTLGFASSTSLTVSGNAYITGLSATNATITSAIFTAASSTHFFASNLNSTIAVSTVSAADTGFFPNLISSYATTTSLATTYASTSQLFGAGLVDCSSDTQTLNYTASTGQFSCLTDATGGGTADWIKNTASDAITPTSTVGIVVNASSTIGGGTATTGLNINGGATSTSFKITSLTGARAIFTDASSLLTTVGLSQYLIDSLSDETGTGGLVFSTNPLLVGFRSSASSTIGNSTGSGGLTVSGNSTTSLNHYVGGSLAVGTTTPSSLFQVFSTATTTMSLDSNSVTRGTCIEMKDSDGVGYTYISAKNGTLYSSTVSCK